jgi:type IV secretion system protein VirB9
MNRSPIFPLVLGLVATVAHGQQSARIVKYHANDIVSVRAKMRYTTLIELPATEKILEVATGDKDFWIIDAVGNYCFLHPARAGIHSNLNLITDKGTVYSFTLDDDESAEPDLKVVIEPSDASSIAAVSGADKLVPADQVAAAQVQAQLAQQHAAQSVEEFRANYPTQMLQFDYTFHDAEPFHVSAIYHDDRFTYIKSTAAEKFSVCEVKDGKPDLINYQLKDGTYIIPKIVDKGYLEIGKHKLTFERKAQSGVRGDTSSSQGGSR